MNRPRKKNIVFISGAIFVFFIKAGTIERRKKYNCCPLVWIPNSIERWAHNQTIYFWLDMIVIIVLNQWWFTSFFFDVDLILVSSKEHTENSFSASTSMCVCACDRTKLEREKRYIIATSSIKCPFMTTLSEAMVCTAATGLFCCVFFL